MLQPRVQSSRVQQNTGNRRAAVTQVVPRASRSRRPPVITCTAQNSSGDAFADIKRIAKKIQGALPIVGLVSRLSAPGGGFDEVSYPEFCRSAFDTAGPSVRDAVVELERRYGKLGQSRWLYFVLWMARHGNGLVPPKNIILAAKRLRVTQDVEIEMDRFETTRDATLAKYRMMQRPKGKTSDAVDLAVDGVSILCLGLGDTGAVKAEDEGILTDIICYVLVEASREEVLNSIRSRPQRVSVYI